MVTATCTIRLSASASYLKCVFDSCVLQSFVCSHFCLFLNFGFADIHEDFQTFQKCQCWSTAHLKKNRFLFCICHLSSTLIGFGRPLHCAAAYVNSNSDVVRLLNKKDKRSKCSVLKVAKFHRDVKIFHNGVDVKGAAVKWEAADELIWKPWRKSVCLCCGGKFNTVLGCFSRGRWREEIKLYFKSFLW